MREGTGWLAAVAVLCCACSHDLGDHGPAGHSIRGTVRYEGMAARSFAEPAWLVLATTTPAPDAIPHALVVRPTDDVASPQPYELRFVPAGRYYLIAQLIDLAAFDPLTAPVGAYPDGCVLTAQPESRSLTVPEDEDVEGADVLVRDSIFADPCFEEAALPELDPCPRAGRMAVEVRLTGVGAIASGDRLVLGLYPAFPPAPGEGVQLIGRGELDVPLSAAFNEQPPGDYVVYACLDRGGDAPDGICGDDDLWAVSAAAESFGAGEVHTVTVDLGAGTVERGASVAPDPVACVPSAQLEVRVTATPPIDPPPSAGDVLAVTLFDSFPSATRPPDFLAQQMGPAFPATLSVPADPGDYYVVVCFQRATSTSEDCMDRDAGDRLGFYMGLGAEAVLREGETTTIDVELRP